MSALRQIGVVNCAEVTLSDCCELVANHDKIKQATEKTADKMI